MSLGSFYDVENTEHSNIMLILPDRTDIGYLIVSIVSSVFFLNLGFPGDRDMVFGYITHTYFFLTVGLFYLICWSWRWGYFGIFHMMANQHRLIEDRLKGKKSKPNINFFGLIVTFMFLLLFVIVSAIS